MLVAQEGLMKIRNHAGATYFPHFCISMTQKNTQKIDNSSNPRAKRFQRLA